MSQKNFHLLTIGDQLLYGEAANVAGGAGDLQDYIRKLYVKMIGRVAAPPRCDSLWVGIPKTRTATLSASDVVRKRRQSS